MKKIILFLLLFVSIRAAAQPTGYTLINARYEWLAGKFKTLHIPAGTDTANALLPYRGAGAVFADTTAPGKGVYYWLDSHWNLFGSGSGGSADSTIFATLYRVDTAKQNIRNSIPAQFNSIAGYGQLITGTYPNRTFTLDTATAFPAIRATIPSGGGGGGSYTFTQGLTESGGVAKVNNNRNIEYITKQTSGSSLDAGWTAVGSPTYTVSSGNWNFNGNGNNYTQYIRRDTGVLADKAYIEVEYTINTVVSTSEGPKIMFKSFNSYSGGIYQHDVAAGYVTGGSAANTGKAYIYGKTGASTSYSDSARVSVAGDVIRLRIDRDGLSYTVTVSNVTKGWYLTKYVQCTPAGSPFVPNNAAYPAFVPGQDDITVTSFKYVIKAPLKTEYLIAGNSIMMGQGATFEASTGSRNVGDYNLNIVQGGGADGTAELVKCLGEIIAIKPENFLLGEFAGNDILFSVSSATWQANINRLHDDVIAAGIPVIITLPTPRTATDVSALKNYIDTSSRFRQSVKISGTWDDLASGTALKTEYNADGTHPNTAGHMAWAAAINKRLHLPNGSDGAYFAKNAYTPNGRFIGTDAGTGADQFDAGGLIAKKLNATQSIQMGVDATGPYIGAYTPGSSYDGIRIMPAGDPNLIIGISGISGYKTSIRNIVAGTTDMLALIHGGSYSANDQETRLSYFNGTARTATIANYLHSSSKFGLRFWSYNGSAINTKAGLSVTGDNDILFGKRHTLVGDTTLAKYLGFRLSDSALVEMPAPAGGGGGGMSNPMTTAGDIIYGGSGGTPTRLAAGTDGYVLTLASGVPSWAASASAGIANQTTVQSSSNFYISGIGRADGYLGGRTTGARDGFKTGGLIAFSSSGSSNWVQMGYDAAGNYGWIQSATEGSAYRPLILSPAGGSFTGVGNVTPTAFLHINASTTAAASLRLPSGTAPTSPNHGDMWTDASHLSTRLNGVTYQLDQQVAAANITNGTYTPTPTATANLDAIAVSTCQYSRNGNVVTVSGEIGTFDPTVTATLTTFTITLPIATTATAATTIGGTAADDTGTVARIRNNGSSVAEFRCTPTDITNRPMSFTFTYLFQ